MNTKRLILAALAVFVFVFFYNWLFHEVIMKQSYINTAGLWRTPEEMQSNFGWLIAGQFLFTLMFCVIYALRGSPQVGLRQGVGYGALIGLLQGSTSLIMYAVQPVPFSMSSSWFISDLIQMSIAGAILGAIYRPTATPPTISPQPNPS